MTSLVDMEAMHSAANSCKLVGKNEAMTDPFHLANRYAGIPSNLLLNAGILVVLLVLFVVLRKNAFKMLISKTRVDRVASSVTQLLFAFADNFVSGDDPDHEEEEAGPSHRRDEATERPGRPLKRAPTLSNTRRSFSVSHSDMTFWQWLASIFTLSDEDIADFCGNDALQYLRFQRHIIGYLIVVCVCSMGIILPLNFQGHLQGNITAFEHTTLANLDAHSELLWVHVMVSFLFFPLSIIIMRRFSTGVRFRQANLEVSRTLIISNIPASKCEETVLREFFNEAFEDVTIEAITFAYDVENLEDIALKREQARQAREYCERQQELERDPVLVRPAYCGRCCSCLCCCITRVDGLEFYSNEESELNEAFEHERRIALQRPLGLAFITFSDLNMSKRVFDAFRRRYFGLLSRDLEAADTNGLKTSRWSATFASSPDDIYWSNLKVKGKHMLVRRICVNLLLFIVTFFLTTPEVLAGYTETIFAFFGLEVLLPGAIVSFLPTILLWTFTALLPVLVAWSDRFLSHWTRSEENHSTMKKTFWYLVLMVVFLPTFGFTTAEASFNFLVSSNATSSEIWQCVFLPDSGAFFVNYIITAALAGAGLELTRFPEFLWYTVNICASRSEAEKPGIRAKLKTEFRFGEQYARMMLIFCMTLMFSVSCPLITPFGLLYFLCKHYVDRHNVVYAYKPSRINKHVHSTAIGFVILCVVILQFTTMLFLIIRAGSITTLSLKSKVSIGLFFLSVNVLSAQVWAETCQKFSPIDYVESFLLPAVEGDDDFIYLPVSLMSKEQLKRHKRRQNKEAEQEQLNPNYDYDGASLLLASTPADPDVR